MIDNGIWKRYATGYSPKGRRWMGVELYLKYGQVGTFMDVPTECAKIGKFMTGAEAGLVFVSLPVVSGLY